MAREGLKLELNAAIRKVIVVKKDMVFKDLYVKTNGDVQTINLVVKPITKPEAMKGLIMVILRMSILLNLQGQSRKPMLQNILMNVHLNWNRN